MRKPLAMTTCRCDKNDGDLVITREYLDKLIAYNQLKTRTEVLDLVIDLLNTKRKIWFHQSLTAGTATFWQNKVKTTEQLLNEIEEMKCQVQ